MPFSPLLGVLISIAFIGFCLFISLYYTRDSVKGNPQMFAFVFLITILASIFVIDNVIAFKVQLLTDEEDKFILHTISLVMAYALGGAKKE